MSFALLLLLGLGGVLRSQQQHARTDLIERFELRARIGSRFLASYIADSIVREQQVATTLLARSSVSQRSFVTAARMLSFQAAVLLDSEGQLLRVLPNDRGLLGTDLTEGYEHLRAAVGGRVAVSNVVSSAARADPIVAIAVPFDTLDGRRVFSGGISIAQTSLGTVYLRNLSPLRDATVWLLDDQGHTIASSSSAPQTADLLQRQDSDLSAAMGESAQGRYDGPHGSARFVSVPVAGTPWHLVVAAPESQVFLPIAGTRSVVPWAVFVGLVAAVGAAGMLLMRLARSRARELHQIGLLSLTDPLTSLYNRRGYELLATQILKDAAREADAAVIMFFDMDGLKAINDGLGHQAGNDALVAAGDLLRSTFRDSDVVARIGGDEFCVVGKLPGPPNDGSAQLARLDDALELYNSWDEAPFRLALSGGVATFDPRHPRPLQDLEAEADARMYEAKKASKSARAV